MGISLNSTFRPDLRPLGPSGAVLRTVLVGASDPYGLRWDILSQSDIVPDFRINSISTQTGSLVIGQTLIDPRFYLTYIGTPSGVYINAVGSGTQQIPSGYATGIFSGTFSTSGFASGYNFIVGASGSYGTSSTGYTVRWYQRQYFGATTTGVYNSMFISELPRSVISSGHALTFSVTGASTQYLFYAFRAAAGVPRFKDETVGLYGGFQLEASGVSFTNDYGITESYNVWRSHNHSLGAVRITVEDPL